MLHNSNLREAEEENNTLKRINNAGPVRNRTRVSQLTRNNASFFQGIDTYKLFLSAELNLVLAQMTIPYKFFHFVQVPLVERRKLYEDVLKKNSHSKFNAK